MISFLRTLASNRRLLKELVVRDLKARYVGSTMGFFWSVVFPLINLVVYTFVFRTLLSVRFGDKAGIPETAVWMLAAIVVWSAFAETLTRATNCLVENANLIQKVVFPAGVLPVYLTISSIVNMSIGIPIVLAAVLYFDNFGGDADAGAQEVGQVATLSAELPKLPDLQEAQREPRFAACNECDYVHVLVCPTHGDNMRIVTPREGPDLEERSPKELGLGITLLALPLLMLLQGVFTVGLGLFFSAFNLILRDTAHVMGVLVMVWMFSTPIFYPPNLITDPKHNGAYDFILDYNPMYWLIDSYREVMLFDNWPNFGLLGQFALVAVVVLFLGATFFESQRERFPDLL